MDAGQDCEFLEVRLKHGMMMICVKQTNKKPLGRRNMNLLQQHVTLTVKTKCLQFNGIQQ